MPHPASCHTSAILRPFARGDSVMAYDYNQLHLVSPETLDLNALSQDAYHAVVGPALQVAAEAAAKRGDPTLHADMPAMLALVDISSHLAHLYGETYHDSGVNQDKLDGAPAAACVMVLQEAEMEPWAIEECLGALQAAYKQMYENSVVDEARPFIAHAWEHLVDGQREQAHGCLTMATHTIIAAIENWREQVEQMH